MTKARPYSAAHETVTVLAIDGFNFIRGVMLTGRGGLFGSTPGLFVGMGF